MFNDNLDINLNNIDIFQYFQNLDSYNFSSDIKDLIFFVFSLYKYSHILNINNIEIEQKIIKIINLIDFIKKTKDFNNILIQEELLNIINDIKTILLKYKNLDQNFIFSFNYYLWFFYDFLKFYSNVDIDILLIDNPIFYLNKITYFEQKYERILFTILNNLYFDWYPISIDYFSKYLDLCIQWKLENHYWYPICIDDDKKSFFFDILLNTKILYLEKKWFTKYYIYYMGNIVEYNFLNESHVNIISWYIIDFNWMYDFFEEFIHKLPISKELMLDFFKKIHYEK